MPFVRSICPPREKNAPGSFLSPDLGLVNDSICLFSVNFSPHEKGANELSAHWGRPLILLEPMKHRHAADPYLSGNLFIGHAGPCPELAQFRDLFDLGLLHSFTSQYGIYAELYTYIVLLSRHFIKIFFHLHYG